MIVDWIFTLLDIASLMFCSMYVVTLLPRSARVTGDRRILCAVRAAAWLVYALLTVMIPTVWQDDAVTMAGITLYYVMAGYLLYHRDRVGTLYQVGFMFSLYATQMIAIFAAAEMWGVFSLEHRTHAYCLVLLKAFLLIAITFVFKVLIRKRYMSVQMRFRIRGMLLVPVISMVLIFMFAVGSDVFLLRFGHAWLIVYCALVLVINLYCLYFWHDVSKTQELKHKLELTRQQNELTHQFYADLESNYAKSRKVIHDIRNHLQVLEQSQKFAGSRSYVADMHQMLNALGMTYYTDNRMLNIILNDKLKSLNQEQFYCSLMGVRLGFLSDMDTTTIFANLLDNALEECRGNQDFRLHLQGEQIQDFCVIKMSNTTEGTYTPGRSSKTGHDGIGLENVRNAVEKYHGEMQTVQREDVFSVTLLFPDNG